MYLYQAFTILSFISAAAAGHPQKNYNVSTTVSVTKDNLGPIRTVIWTSCSLAPGGKDAGCGVHTKTMLPKKSEFPAPSVMIQSQPHRFTNTTRAPKPKPTTFIFLNTSAPVVITQAPKTTIVNTTSISNTTTMSNVTTDHTIATANLTTAHPIVTANLTTAYPIATANITTTHPIATANITTAHPIATVNITTAHPIATANITTAHPIVTENVTTNHTTATITTSSAISFHNQSMPLHTSSTTLPVNFTLSTTMTASVDFHNSTFRTTFAHSSASHSNYTYSNHGNYSRPFITNGHRLAVAEIDSAAAISNHGSAVASTSGTSMTSIAPHLSVSLVGILLATLFLSVTIN